MAESTRRKCETCGNTYDKTFEVTIAGSTHVFDSFECAVHALAPRCANCGVPIISQGVESGGVFFCGGHCARAAGVAGIQDRAAEAGPAAV